jgi:hypothetical protein
VHTRSLRTLLASELGRELVLGNRYILNVVHYVILKLSCLPSLNSQPTQ